MIYVLGGLIIKMYGRFKLKEETRFVLSKYERIALWVSLATFFSYLIQ